VRLSVYHNQTRVGYLQTREGGLSFSYDLDYLNSAAGHPLSCSLPLQERPHPFHTTERFFDGLLPEGEERRRIARYLRVSSGSLARLLAALAGDCVGNLTILNETQSIEELVAKSGYRPLPKEVLTGILGSDGDTIARVAAENRLSIPGAQPKIGLYCAEKHATIADTEWYVPEGLAASTHIIKPSSLLYGDTALNEYCCSRIAVACKIATAHMTLHNHEGRPVLISRRFDRAVDEDGTVLRLFQEDFCQALSFAPENKYELEGGPSFLRMLGIVRHNASDPVTESLKLLRIFLFNYLIGNCDAHAKNYSLQRSPEGILRLTPAYDLVSTTFYKNLSTNVAMGVNNVFRLERISRDDFKRFSESTSLSWQTLVRVAGELARQIHSTAPKLEVELAALGFAQSTRPLTRHLLEEAEKRAAIIA
jgi:serine/threonine-protein kinase HipA